MAESRTRKVPMEVLALSMPRTGTTSLQAALEILGIQNCYHAYTAFGSAEDCKMWSAALEAKYHGRGAPFTRSDWDKLLGKYSAVSADPAMIFAEEFVEVYPEAKVILVEREIESWYRSFDTRTVPEAWDSSHQILMYLDPQLMGHVGGMWNRVFRDAEGFYRSGSKERMRANLRQVYRDHYALVRRVTPRDRLLEFRVQDGWEPLCKFLGKDVPACPFPRLNEGEAITEFVADFQKKCIRNVVRNVALAGISIITAYLALSSWWWNNPSEL